MSRTSISTPCPAPYSLSGLPIASRRLSVASNGSFQDDTTTNIEYTRAVQSDWLQTDFRDAKPRRKSTFQRRDKKQAAVTIFEDVIEDEELVVPSRLEIGGSTLLGRPARKVPVHAVARTEASRAEDGRARNATAPSTTHARSRPSIGMQPVATTKEDGRQLESSQRPSNNGAEGEAITDGIKKDPRRRTIFVPSEDTTMLTIHPGAHTTHRLDDTFKLQYIAPHQPIPSSNEPDRDQPVKRPRMSLAVAPKRVPLQETTTKEGNVPGIDVAGHNGGKENVPPHVARRADNEKPYTKPKSGTARHSTIGSKLFEPTAASKARQTVVARQAMPLPNASRSPRDSRNASDRVTPKALKVRRDAQVAIECRISPQQFQQAAKPRRASLTAKAQDASARVERKTALGTARLQQYPILSENLAQPELYEDNWLSHQEIALTELINQIFEPATPKRNQWPNESASLRERMIELYHRPQVSAMHQRLNASLLYGALSRPRDGPTPLNPSQDIELRKRFLNLWLDSYEAQSLLVAAEVVFGRQLRQNSDVRNDSLDPHRNRRELISFLETFLVEVDDVETSSNESSDEPNARWRKMVLRSLLLIWLLDQAKQSKVIDGCLFKSSSSRKSSNSVLHALTALVVPSTGDVTRILRHLEYEVSHTQDPLDEVHYRIDNVAVDLRDGIFLTKLVEVLLFQKAQMKEADMRADATVTIQMPDLTILESALDPTERCKNSRILSQHLKMPCIGRAQKLFNIQVAMSALYSHGKIASSTTQVTAEDIVDGHREKTLSLLWSLVSSHGLENLVDFEELAADSRRVTETNDMPARSDGCNFLSQTAQESLLKKWASAYAARLGVRISNLTTSFADGRAYAAILEAFADYIPVAAKPHPRTSPNAQVEAHLDALGCSHSFIKQLSLSNGTIPSRRTTVSNLASLASRLLPLSRQCNAARTIQRAFRMKQARLLISRRVILMRLAHACATVVQTQQRLVCAATVLQIAWRGVLDARSRRLNRHVEVFQAISKAWVVGRNVRPSITPSLRVMGDW